MRGVIPEHLQARFDALNELKPMTAPPKPWRFAKLLSVGGLTGVGFGNSSDLLLVTSHSGRGVVNCRSSAFVARDDGEFRFDIGNLLVEGIGPLAGMPVRVSGVQGGGMPCKTDDGWGIERIPLSWPDDEFILSPPGQTMLWSPPNAQMNLFKLAKFSAEVRAFGFSPTGLSMLVATAADISIFTREN